MVRPVGALTNPEDCTLRVVSITFEVVETSAQLGLLGDINDFSIGVNGSPLSCLAN